MKIQYIDTDGIKGSLPEGYLGYDKVTADRGRVAVGTNTGDVLLAKKDEVDAVDSTAVKLVGDQTVAGIKTFSSVISGNISGNSGTATKLATARTINGVAFDGTANITAPTNLGITAGTTAGPVVTSSSGTNATLPTASATASGVMTTGAQTFAGVKIFSSSPIVPTPTTDFQVATKKYVDDAYYLQPTMTANATLTGSNNKIAMNGIVTSLGLEIGDVIQFKSVANANNQKMRTVESIINNNEIIVNYEHCGNRGNGSLKLTDETLTNATITRIAKWYNAPLGLGQEWVSLESARSNGVLYSNLTNRAIAVSVRLVTGGSTGTLGTGGTTVSSRYTAETTVISSPLFVVVPLGLTYSQVGLGFNAWVELR